MFRLYFFFIFYYLKHWIQLIQSYKHVFQNMSSSQRAYVDSNKEIITTRWVIIQRSESFQPHLLGQTSMFFNYFESIEFSSIRATIMPFKVCRVVKAHMLIRAREEILLDEWSISAVNLLNLDY